MKAAIVRALKPPSEGRQMRSNQNTVIVAGGAGFLGSHLCELLLGRGDRVLCIDNFVTGNEENLRDIESHERFSMLVHDICAPLPAGIQADRIFNLACAASPPTTRRIPFTRCGPAW